MSSEGAAVATSQPKASLPLFDADPSRQPAIGTLGIVCANQAVAGAAGAEMFSLGGNAVDAGIAALFTLCVVEPMMVGICGAGVMTLRLADGSVLGLDNYATAPEACHPDSYQPKHPEVDKTSPLYFLTVDDKSSFGIKAVSTPGSLKAWCWVLEQYGRLSLEEVLRPAIARAEHGFRVSSYLHAYLKKFTPELQRCPHAAAIFLPRDGEPPLMGELFKQPELAQTLRRIAQHGSAELYGRDGHLGASLAKFSEKTGGYIRMRDLLGYGIKERMPIRGHYRGYTIIGAPLCSAGGVHLVQLLHIMEHFDVAGLGAGTADAIDVMAQAMAMAFRDRNRSTGDPDFVDVPVVMLTSHDYAAQCAAQIRCPATDNRDMHSAASLKRKHEDSGSCERSAGHTCYQGASSKFDAMPSAGCKQRSEAAEPPHTTHVTAADKEGNVVAMTQTLNWAFGACTVVPGTGVLLNNCQVLFDPRPGQVLSPEPGKRPTSSMAPTLVLRPNGEPMLAIGKIGGTRIFPSVLQIILNLIDHKMPLQKALNAPLMWSRGGALELERRVAGYVEEELRCRGYEILFRDAIGGGASAVHCAEDGILSGACCWRADGHAVAMSGGEMSAEVEPHF